MHYIIFTRLTLNIILYASVRGHANAWSMKSRMDAAGLEPLSPGGGFQFNMIVSNRGALKPAWHERSMRLYMAVSSLPPTHCWSKSNSNWQASFRDHMRWSYYLSRGKYWGHHIIEVLALPRSKYDGFDKPTYSPRLLFTSTHKSRHWYILSHSTSSRSPWRR